MAPIDDDTLDRLLSEHLSSRLDPHLGRAEASFRQHLAHEPAWKPKRVGPAFAAGDSSLVGPRMTRTSGFWKRLGGHGLWLTGIVGTAVAASLATLWVLPQLERKVTQPATPEQSLVAKSPDRPGSPIQTTTVSTVSKFPTNRPTVRAVQNRVWDEGTVTPKGPGVPMRQMRYQQLEQYRWYDPDHHSTIDMVVPREGVKLYELDTY